MDEDKPARRRRTKEEIQRDKVIEEQKREEKARRREARERADAMKPQFICCTGIGEPDGPNHDLSDETKAVDTKQGLVCPLCYPKFHRTMTGVNWFNSMYALPDAAMTLDVAAAQSFKEHKERQKGLLSNVVARIHARRGA